MSLGVPGITLDMGPADGKWVQLTYGKRRFAKKFTSRDTPRISGQKRKNLVDYFIHFHKWYFPKYLKSKNAILHYHFVLPLHRSPVAGKEWGWRYLGDPCASRLEVEVVNFFAGRIHLVIPIDPIVHTLPETNSKSPENRPGPKRKQSYSNHPFSRAMLVAGRGILKDIKK